MIAVILNSGLGSRLGSRTLSTPKCLTELDSRTTILSNQLDVLAQAGIGKFVITTGHLADKLTAYVSTCFPKLDVGYAYNPDYATSHYILSTMNAASMSQDDVLFLHGDLIFSAETLELLLACPHSAITMDSTLPVPERDFKVDIGRSLRVKAVGVDITGENCVACQPFYKLKRKDWLQWQHNVGQYCSRGAVNVFAEDALNDILGSINLHAVDVRGRLCMEVDTEADLKLAKTRFAAYNASRTIQDGCEYYKLNSYT